MEKFSYEYGKTLYIFMVNFWEATKGLPVIMEVKQVGQCTYWTPRRGMKCPTVLRAPQFSLPQTSISINIHQSTLAALAQMVACLPLVQRVRGSIPGGVVNFHMKIFNLGARRGGDVHFIIARLYITSFD